MPTFYVYLGNPNQLRYPWQSLCEQVHALIEPALRHTQRFDAVRVRSTMAAPALIETDVIVYVVRSQLQSILARRLEHAPSPNHQGSTAPSAADEVASEAYMQGTDTTQLARVIVHELMHNKTNLGNEQLHRLGGVCATPPQAPTTQNQRLLARHMSRKVRQWLGGFSN
jgi:hypothetical protein